MKRRLSVLLLIVMLVVGGLSAVSVNVAYAAQCSLSNLRAWDMGGGVPWNRNFVIDVYGTTNNSGYFLYYDPTRSSWMSIRLSSHYLINNNTGIRFGVSTSWAYTHPWWQSTAWRYVYNC